MQLTWLDPDPRVPVERCLCRVVDALQRARIPFWLCGGYALEAYAGRPLREHKDSDLLVRAEDGPRLVVALSAAGCAVHSSDSSALHIVEEGHCLVDLLLLREHRRGVPLLDSPSGAMLLPPNSLAPNAIAQIWGRPVPLISLEGLYVMKARRPPGPPTPPVRQQEDLALIRRLLLQSHRRRAEERSSSRAA